MKPTYRTLPETNISPENVRPLEIRRFLLETTIFRHYLENVPYIPSPSLFRHVVFLSNRGGGTTLLRSRRWMFGPMEMDVQVNQGSLYCQPKLHALLLRLFSGHPSKMFHPVLLLVGPFLQHGIPSWKSVPYPRPDFPYCTQSKIKMFPTFPGTV